MHHGSKNALVLCVVAALMSPLAGPGGAAAADDPPGLLRTTTAGTLPDREVQRAIAHGCTKSSEEILAAVQGLRFTQEFTTIRHRGDFDASIPENSLNAFEESYLRCRGGIETDLRRTADDTLVMFHDTHVGKMLEPMYDPVTDTGPNAALSSLTWEELQQKTLVNIDREPDTGEKVPSFDEFLDHYRRVGAQTLLYVEIKNSTNDKQVAQDEIMDAVEQVAAFDRAHPDLDIFDRVVFKFRMSAFPVFSQWTRRLQQIPDLPRVPLTQVQVSRQIARDIRSDGTIVGQGDTRLDYAVQTWAYSNATDDGVLSVEVTMKDSSGYANVETRGDDGTNPLPFHAVTYSAPRQGTHAKPGTMARATQLVREAGKPLGQFVPIPDWALFRSPDSFDWDEDLPNIDPRHTAAPLTPRDAFFNNTSACCYSLRDRVDSTSVSDGDPEQNDQRLLLPWLEDLGATILTADDTDSIDAYFADRGKKLDTGDNRLSPNRPDPAMNSAIFPGAQRLPSLMKLVTLEVLPRGTNLNWFVSVDATLSEDVASARPRHATHRSTDGPVPLMAVHGASTLRVRASWSWSGDPDTKHEETIASWPVPEHLADGQYSWPMWIGSTPVDVRATVSRSWATADEVRVVIDESEHSHVWGSVCGLAAAELASEARCDSNNRDGAVLTHILSTDPQAVSPGDSLDMRRTSFTGARPLGITTRLWGRHWIDGLVSDHLVRVDGPAWGRPLSQRAPGDDGLAVVHYVLRADGFRVPL